MHLLYILVAGVIVAAATVFLTPIVGVISFVLLAGLGLALFGGLAGARIARTSTPEPSGRPRPSQSGVTTSNQRQGQD
jgi:hypothetical protein